MKILYQCETCGEMHLDEDNISCCYECAEDICFNCHGVLLKNNKKIHLCPNCYKIYCERYGIE